MNAADVANKFKEVDDCTAVEAVIGYAYKIAPGIAQSALDEIDELRNKVAAYEADAPAAKLARANALAAERMRIIEEMTNNIEAGRVIVTCTICKGDGEYTEMNGNDPDSACDVKCEYCTGGENVYKCVKE